MVVRTAGRAPPRDEVERAGHRQDREEAAGGAARRLHPQLLEARRVAGLRSGEGLDAAAARCRRPGTRCARRSATSAHTLPPGIRARSSTTSSATSSATSTRSPATASRTRELKEYADRIRNELLRVPDVAKVELIGEQDEKIYIEIVERQARARSASTSADDRQRARDRRTRSRRPACFETADRQDLPRAPAATSTRSRRSARRSDPRQRAALPPRRHRRRVSAATPTRRSRKMRFTGQGGARHRRLDGEGRRHHRARARTSTARSTRLRRRAAGGPRARRRCTTSRAAVKRSVDEFVRSLAEAVVIVLAVSFARRSACAPGSSSRSRSRSCWRSPSSSCTTAASTCTRSRSAR